MVFVCVCQRNTNGEFVFARLLDTYIKPTKVGRNLVCCITGILPFGNPYESRPTFLFDDRVPITFLLPYAFHPQ